MQLSVDGKAYLIDPLAIDDLSPLGVLLAAPSVVKVLHAADYDIRSLDRDWSFRISPLFDTSIAAAFCGYRKLGLGTVLKECLGVEIPKNKRLQRADWTVRPIPLESREYAVADVRHLGRLSEFLLDRLGELGRTEWVQEECERLAAVRYMPSDAETAFRAVRGSRDLDRRGLTILRSLYRFRQEEAVRRDRPPFKILPDMALVALAMNPDGILSEVKGIGRYAHGKGASNLKRALRLGAEAEPVVLRALSKPKRHRVGVEERKSARNRLRSLKEWRLNEAGNLGIDPALVWPATSLERLSLGLAEFDEEERSGDVRRWQSMEFGNSLSEYLSSH